MSELTTELRWRVLLPTVTETVFTFAIPRIAGAPWPAMPLVAALHDIGFAARERPRALGRGRGVPLIHEQYLERDGIPLDVTAVGAGEIDEVRLALPAGDELCAGPLDEDSLWEIVDAAAAASHAAHGTVGDGEATALPGALGAAEWRARLLRHLGLLLPRDLAAELPAADVCRYRELPESGLEVLLR